MGKFIDLTGQEFGRLTVLHLHAKSEPGAIRWVCMCQCGKEHTATTGALRAGSTRSCGCLRAEVLATCRRTHGKSRTKVYDTWKKMISRCHNLNDHGYKHYGARGIVVCARWHKFENFYEDMGEPPTSRHSIDRYPNKTGNYEPGNARWATQKEQCNNKMNNVTFPLLGRTMTMEQWAEEFDLSPSTVRGRLERGWPFLKAITTSPNGYD